MRNGNTTKWIRLVPLVTAALGLALCAGLPAAGQSTPATQTQTPPKPPATATPGQAPAAGQQNPGTQAPAVNQAEEDAYKAIYGMTVEQNTDVITQGEAFLSKFPTSRYRSSVYSKLVHAYLNTHQPAKTVDVSEKALAENPDNVDVLAVVCTIIPLKLDPRSLDADQKLSEAERYARHAIELVNAMTMPEGGTPEQFTAAKNELLGLAHYGLGLVAFRRQNPAQSVAELEQATKLDPNPDPLEFFLLGRGDMDLKKFSDAAAAFDRCANTPWIPQWQENCKKGEADAKQQAAAAPAATPAPAKP